MARVKQSKEPEDRRYGVRQVAMAAAQVTKRAFGKRGFAMTELLIRWPAIAGDSVAQHSIPEKLTFPQGKTDGGTLLVRVDGAMGLEFQHLQPVLIERINAQCGFRAVSHLKIIQGPIGRPARKVVIRRKPLGQAQSERLGEELSPVTDPGLRAALARLGTGVLGRKMDG